MRSAHALLLVLCALLGPVGTVAAAVHTVRSGQTLSHIAVRYGVSVNDLRRWNGLADDRIRVGQRLTVATDDGGQYTVRPGDTLSEIAARFRVRLTELRRLNRLRTDRIRTGQTLRLRQIAPTGDLYKVRAGDTLSEIALRHGTSVSRLRALNHLRGDGIRVGQSLRLGDSSAARAASPGGDEEDPSPETYTVRPGDTLSEIGVRFDVGLSLLRRLNGLTGDRIRPGQKLRLRPSREEEGIHVVQSGQNLSTIAALYRIDLAELRRLNGIEGDLIRPGQKLRLRTTPSSIHVVERGDALWEIARAYDVSVADLRSLNGLSSDRIFPGQQLRLTGDTTPRLSTYTVASGDNLSEIAQLHQMSVAELQGLNGLSSSLIHPGQVLKVRPLLGGGPRLAESDIPWDDLLADIDGMRRIELDNGPYFGKRPRASRQPRKGYSETNPPSPLRTYRQARALWKAFEARVSRLGRVSDALAGWHVVLDPGHGGIDPGTIVPTVAGDGTKLYIVEDEYVYDIALRAYVLLRLYGARVDITLLSPNHLIRHTSPPAQTFVHEMNEVFNSYTHNRSDRVSQWPVGTARGLATRVRIARQAFQGTPKNRTIFLSFHADIDPNSPEVPLVLYYESRRGRNRDLASRRFARALLPSLGAGARTRGQSLAVLRNNPAAVKVLIEVRNLAYVDQAWALRFEQLRHRDAEKIVKGLVDYAQSQQLARR